MRETGDELSAAGFGLVSGHCAHAANQQTGAVSDDYSIKKIMFKVERTVKGKELPSHHPRSTLSAAPTRCLLRAAAGGEFALLCSGTHWEVTDQGAPRGSTGSWAPS